MSEAERYTLADLQRRIDRMVMVATVTDLDRGNAKARVAWSDNAKSDWLSVAQLGSNETRFWFPPVIGTQVVVISPGGDTARGIIYPGPFAGNVPAGNFDGPLVGASTITLDGRMDATDDVTADGVSLVTHVHPGDGSGPGDTGPPS